uniref:DUF4283 domain-containing protein n=1 Tax=Quercus lobata TaxID=97700 RepID=A0A7N2L2Q0_QUELO
MEELTKTWNSLTLSECECSNFRIKEDQAKIEFIIAAKFLTKRALNIDSIAKTFTPIWRSRNGFKIQKESSHVVLFTFDDKNEMEKVMATEPWSFDKRLMVLQRFGKEMDLKDMEFNKVTFWVQVHDLPIRFQTRRIAEQLCEAIGKVNVGTDEDETEGDNFLRVRVTIDISQPLYRGRVILLDSGKEMWVPFKYERLPSLCFWCGCLTHDDRDCELWAESEGSLTPESQEFGPWLKAAPFMPSRCYMVKVPGFFTGKKAGTSSEKPSVVKKAPMVVVRSVNQVLEIFRTEMESLETHIESNMESVLQDVSPHKPKLPTDEGSKEDGMLHQAETLEEKVSGEAFKEEIRELDEEIKKYDKATTVPPSLGVYMGKENIESQPCINEPKMPCPTAHVAKRWWSSIILEKFY